MAPVWIVNHCELGIFCATALAAGDVLQAT